MECAPRGGDAIEHLGQDETVDDVAANFDLFDEPGRRGFWFLGHERSIAGILGLLQPE